MKQKKTQEIIEKRKKILVPNLGRFTKFSLNSLLCKLEGKQCKLWFLSYNVNQNVRQSKPYNSNIYNGIEMLINVYCYLAYLIAQIGRISLVDLRSTKKNIPCILQARKTLHYTTLIHLFI